ncbi:Annexin domain-containing protein [Cephalotus follicularis]|uniref:Annexin domain-containing protein n=1 Tax=Cephalotus follicularis TaxID=3775 RepID=A0A1Q3CFX2_CEPFO|nr:Annexin domain-containing protein [Cephalotus follicularis]
MTKITSQDHINVALSECIYLIKGTLKRMAQPNYLEALTKAFSGHGIEEKSLISILGKSHPEHITSFRKTTPFFIDDERQFERWDDHHIKLLKREFLRFKNAVVLWAMHPWERDARLVKDALKKGPQEYGTIVEIACTRSSEELLGARRAYHSLFDHSIEEEVATHIKGSDRKLLVALVSAYRYEGNKVKEDTAKSEAKLLAIALKNVDKKKPTEDEEVLRILSTRSKPHLMAVYKYYKDVSGKNLDEDLGADLIFKVTVECICTPHNYFSKVLNTALKIDADKNTKKAVTRVIVTRADTDIKEINGEYQNLFGVSLSKEIEETANGNYKDFLLTLIARGN